MLKLAIRDRAHGRLAAQLLPRPSEQQRHQKVDTNEAPWRALFVDFGRLLDRKRYAWLLFHEIKNNAHPYFSKEHRLSVFL